MGLRRGNRWVGRNLENVRGLSWHWGPLMGLRRGNRWVGGNLDDVRGVSWHWGPLMGLPRRNGRVGRDLGNVRGVSWHRGPLMGLPRRNGRVGRDLGNVCRLTRLQGHIKSDIAASIYGHGALPFFETRFFDRDDMISGFNSKTGRCATLVLTIHSDVGPIGRRADSQSR